METIKKLMQNSENQLVTINKIINDPEVETLWTGLLADIPEEYHLMKVVKTAWSLKEQHNIIYV